MTHRVEDRIAHLQYRWRVENDRFDDWFNAKWPTWQAELRRRCREARTDMREGRRFPLPNTIERPVDVPTLILVGSGVGVAAQGVPSLGVLLALSGVVRSARNFAIQKVDAKDMDGFFRWAPASLGEARRQEIWNKLRFQINIRRDLREADSYASSSQFFGQGTYHHAAMDPLNDYTPEKLFEDAMTSVARHQRVIETLGADVRVASEPDKVIYRIVEGVAEVYLAWRVAGQEAGAEIQVKATACLVDYIYVFPEPVGRYQVAPQSFVIRPKGSWSGNTDDLPRYQKSPFAQKGQDDSGKLYPNRSGVFQMDWSVRDFKHSKEEYRGF